MLPLGTWLARPLVQQPAGRGRRRRLLAWLLLSIFLLTILILLFVLIVDVPSRARRAEYTPLILGLDVLVAIAYCVNAAGYYRAAAGLAVGAAFLGPWGALALDPRILRGDAVPLAYAIIPLLLSGLLLSPLVTGALGAAQFVAFLLIALLNPAGKAVDWPGFLALILSISVLSILSSSIARQDMEEINRQTRALAESEADLREISVRDHLTKLFNRRYLEESLDREIRRSARSHRTIGIILIDADNFKQINDRWGHAAGDLVLEQLGQLLLGHIRVGDIACRYGGDEFVVMLPEASLDATRQRAEHLCDEFHRLKLEYQDQPLGPLAISAGVALYPLCGEWREALIHAADEALYEAKRTGGHGVAVAKGAASSPAE